MLILDLKPLRQQVKGKYSIGREFWSLTIQGMKLLIQTSRSVAAGLKKTEFYQLKCIVEQNQIAITKLQVKNKR